MAENFNREYFQKLARENKYLNNCEIEAHKTRLETYPTFLATETIGRCNMVPHCVMCFLDKINVAMPTIKDPRYLEGYGDFFDRCTHVSECSTGELLIHPQLIKLVEAIDSRGKTMGFTSNGLALTRPLADSLTGYGHMLWTTFSLDAATAETYAKIRGNHFNGVIDNISYYINRRKTLNTPLPSKIALCFIPMRCNRHEVSRFIKLAAELGVDVVDFRALAKIPYRKIVNRNQFVFNYNEQSLSLHELEECRLEAQETSRSCNIEFQCQYHVSNDHSMLKPPELQDFPAYCLMPWFFIFPRYNGDTFPCCYMGKSVGNWREMGLSSIWNNDIVQNLRGALLQNTLPDICLEQSSCPVVRQYANDVKLQKITTCGKTTGLFVKTHRYSVADPGFHKLIESGVFEETFLDKEKITFRWLSSQSRLILPNKCRNSSIEIHLRIKTLKPDIGTSPIIVSISLENQGEKRFIVSDQHWKTAKFVFHGVTGDLLELTITCDNCWRPSDYYKTPDNRSIGVMLSEISLKESKKKNIFVKRSVANA